jgi:hypothetical protein
MTFAMTLPSLKVCRLVCGRAALTVWINSRQAALVLLLLTVRPDHFSQGLSKSVAESFDVPRIATTKRQNAGELLSAGLAEALEREFLTRGKVARAAKLSGMGAAMRACNIHFKAPDGLRNC